MHGMKKKIFPEMSARNPHTADDFGNINLLPEVEYRPINDLGFNRHRKGLETPCF